MGMITNSFIRIRELSSRLFLIIELFLWSIPARLIANLYGLVYGIPIPVVLRKYIFTFWSKYHSVNMEDIEKPLEDYPTLNAFFTRYLKPGIRPLGNGTIVSPIDGMILEHFIVTSEGLPEASKTGESSSQQELQTEAYKKEMGAPGKGIYVDEQSTSIKQKFQDPLFTLPNMIVHVKGVAYSIEDLFGVAPPQLGSNSRYHIFVMHLPPNQYHHVHAPVDCVITHSIRVPGHVGRFHMSRLIPQLLWTNERCVLLGRWNKNLFFSIALVAATAFVASINLQFDPSFKTNYPWDPILAYSYFSGKEPTHIKTRLSNNAYGTNHAGPIPVYGPQSKNISDQPNKGLHVKGYQPPHILHKGEEIGHFNVGSGLVIMLEIPDNMNIQFLQDTLVPGSFHYLGSSLST